MQSQGVDFLCSFHSHPLPTQRKCEVCLSATTIHLLISCHSQLVPPLLLRGPTLSPYPPASSTSSISHFMNLILKELYFQSLKLNPVDKYFIHRYTLYHFIRMHQMIFFFYDFHNKYFIFLVC